MPTLTMQISAVTDERLSELRAMTNKESKTEVIRRALAVYDLLYNKMANQKCEVRLVSPEGDYELLKIDEFN